MDAAAYRTTGAQVNDDGDAMITIEHWAYLLGAAFLLACGFTFFVEGMARRNRARDRFGSVDLAKINRHDDDAPLWQYGVSSRGPFADRGKPHRQEKRS